MYWKTSRRQIPIEHPLVMGILNVTTDSFSDGGQFADPEKALKRAEAMIEEGADIIDIGGESTRPGSRQVSAAVEIARVVPVIESVAKNFDVPISIDTWKAEVAEAAVSAGAEIINDISGLRWDERLADVAAQTKTAIVLMHSRGPFEAMHSQEPVADIFEDVRVDFQRSILTAISAGILRENIALDIGIGFGKTLEQNLALIGRLDEIISEFPGIPVLVGASRKSFIGKLTGGVSADQRLGGSLAAAIVAAQNGARILRVHDIRETVQAIRIAEAIRDAAA